MVNNLALITGSSKGLGFGIAKDLDRRGASVILTGRTQPMLEKAIENLSGKHHYYFPVDFLNEEAVNQLIHILIKKDLIPDIIIHNFGGKVQNDHFPLTHDVIYQSLEMNMEVSIRINEAFLPQMIEKNRGRIIHISSDASLTGQASPAYVISKSALNGYVKSASRYYAKQNVMICAVLPGILEHETSAWSLKKKTHPEHYKNKLEQTPLGRFGQPDEIASFVGELALSDSMMCTGSLFEFRGGQ